jgi:deoxyribodipyrimidine photo-lyase
MTTVLHWFRRDLRLRDNTALAAACNRAAPDGRVLGIFVIDPKWWEPSAEKLGPQQAAFWLESLRELAAALRTRNIPLIIRQGDPVGEILRLARETAADMVTFNKEYEPAQRAMDERLARQAERDLPGLKIRRYKDAAVFEEDEILTGQGKPYTVFTPYKRAYLKALATRELPEAALPRRLPATSLPPTLQTSTVPTAESLGFPTVAFDLAPGEKSAGKLLDRFVERHLTHYAQTRDIPGDPHGTSRLSAHLSAGTLSIRQVFRAVLAAQNSHGNRKSKMENQKSADTFLSELIWREFYRMILFHHPRTITEPFQRKYRRITWRNDPAFFKAWRGGSTGIPFIDAAMRQLAQTGFMHNRLRMLVAMFLTKHLDMHWLVGEQFFMRSLMDYDQASNVGGWQWSASTGTDAAPYFRIMNPVRQSQRFDPEGVYIRRWLPQLAQVPTAHIHMPWQMPREWQQQCRCVIGQDYPAPIVDLAAAKDAAIAKFRP